MWGFYLCHISLKGSTAEHIDWDQIKSFARKMNNDETLTVNSNGDVSQEQIKEGRVPLTDETGWVVGRNGAKHVYLKKQWSEIRDRIHVVKKHVFYQWLE